MHSIFKLFNKTWIPWQNVVWYISKEIPFWPWYELIVFFYYNSKYVKNIKTVLKVSPPNIPRIERWLPHPQSFFFILNSRPQSSGGLNHFIFEFPEGQDVIPFLPPFRGFFFFFFVFWPTSPIWIWGRSRGHLLK